MPARIQAETAATPTVDNTPVVESNDYQGEINQNPTETVQSQEVIESEAHETESSDEAPAQGEEAKSDLSDVDKMKYAFEKRLGKATRQKKELEETSTQQAERIAELERKLAELSNSNVSDEPDINDMTEEEYISYQIQKKQEEFYNKQQETQREQLAKQQAAQQVQADWNAKIQAFGKADFADVVSVAQEYIPDTVKQMALQMDNGPEIIYALSKDIDTLERLNKIQDPDRIKFEVFSLEQRLKNPVSTAQPVPSASKGTAPRVKPFDPQTASVEDVMKRRLAKRRR